MRTELSDLLQISVPIIQSPMAGGGDTAELVAAVSNAGALGSIGAAYLTPEQIIERGRAIRTATSRPFAINLFAPFESPDAGTEAAQLAVNALAPFYAELGMPPPAGSHDSGASFDDQLLACLETGASVFSFTFGLLPSRALKEIRKRKMLLMGTVTTVEEGCWGPMERKTGLRLPEFCRSGRVSERVLFATQNF